jgi:NADH:ubiquinone oxidoreductase subunit F (NADH-binding)
VSAQIYVSCDAAARGVCNADEGDSGTFSDRMLMEGDPFVLLEGMTIAGLATGATQGYIYLRWEYPDAKRALEAAIAAAYAGQYLGADIQGSGRRFDLEVRIGGGAYICGEETSLLESLEGKRGQVRFKPPLPAIQGLFGQPTVINNVITFASVPIILDQGAEYYQHFGKGRSRGTLPLQLTGNIKHGGLVVFDDTVDMAAQARYAMEFCAIESCGKCTPCRLGSTRGVEVIDRLLAGSEPEKQEAVLRDLCETLTYGSLCALGGLTPYPVLSALNHFPEDFVRPLRAAAGIANHIASFWTRRMRDKLAAELHLGNQALDELPREALRLLAEHPADKPTQTVGGDAG